MKKIVAFILLSSFAFSQTPHIDWIKYFGGTNPNNVIPGYLGSYDAQSIQKTSDGGYVIAGVTSVASAESVDYHGSLDGFVVKLNSNYETEWSRCYGTAGTEKIWEIKQTLDGGYVFTGTQYSAATHGDYWIGRLSSTGDLLWQKTYGGSLDDVAESIEVLNTGEFLVAGTTSSSDNYIAATFPFNNHGNSDYWVIKLDSNGNFIFGRPLGGASVDICHTMVSNPDGSYVVAGETTSHDGQVNCPNLYSPCESSIWIAKVANNNFIYNTWASCFSPIMPSANFYNIPYRIIKTNDAGYLIVGQRQDHFDSHIGADFWAIKIDSDGNEMWQNCYGGTKDDVASSVRQTSDGGYIIVGYTYSSNDQVIINYSTNNLMPNAWMIKINANGALQWQKSVSGRYNNFFYDVVEANPNEYIAVGTGPWMGNEGDYTECNGRQFMAVKISTTALNVNENDLSDFSLELFPNPTSSLIHYKTNAIIKSVSYTDISGRCVLESHSDTITETDISSLSSGIYLVKISNGVTSTSRKIIKE